MEGVNILSIEPQGQYAVRLVFDDGHDTGIYTWDTLYALGRDMEMNWAQYLERLEAIGYRRQEPDQGDKRVRLLYLLLAGPEAAQRVRADRGSRRRSGRGGTPALAWAAP